MLRALIPTIPLHTTSTKSCGASLEATCNYISPITVRVHATIHYKENHVEFVHKYRKITYVLIDLLYW